MEKRKGTADVCLLLRWSLLVGFEAADRKREEKKEEDDKSGCFLANAGKRKKNKMNGVLGGGLVGIWRSFSCFTPEK